MRPEQANRQIENFRRRFGPARMAFAYHAAVPLALTPDLVFRLWRAFPCDVEGRPIGTPWIAAAQLLLSNLCREVGPELYEMDAEVRRQLISVLRADERFGEPRLHAVAAFLLDYVERQRRSDDPDARDFALTQRWVALAHLRPSDAIYELAAATATAGSNHSEWVRLAAIVESVAEPIGLTNDETALGEVERLRRYTAGLAGLARGDHAAAAHEFAHLKPTSTGQVEISGVSLHVPGAPTPNGSQTIESEPEASQPANDGYAAYRLRIFAGEQGNYLASFDSYMAVEQPMTPVAVHFDLDELQVFIPDVGHYGRLLGEQLFAANALGPAWREVLAAHNGRLRLSLKVEAPELANLYWERLLAPRDSGWVSLATSAATPFARYIPALASGYSSTDSPSLRVLMIIRPTPDRQEFGHIPYAVIQEIHTALDNLPNINLTYLESNTSRPPTRLNLENALNDQFDVVQFYCYGTNNWLLLENEDGTDVFIGVEQLKDMLRARSVRTGLLVFFGNDTADGFGPSIVEEGIAPSVVAINGGFTIVSTGRFTRQFYLRLLAHGQIDLAVNEVRAALRDHEDWDRLVLFTSLSNGRLFAGATTRAQPETIEALASSLDETVDCEIALQKSAQGYELSVQVKTLFINDSQAFTGSLSVPNHLVELSFDELMNECYFEDRRQFTRLLRRIGFNLSPSKPIPRELADKVVNRLVGKEIDWYKYEQKERERSRKSLLDKDIEDIVASTEWLSDGDSVVINLDLEALEMITEQQAYGQALTEMLFADQSLRQVWQSIRLNAEVANNTALRVRLHLDPAAPELHNIRWELLRDPVTDTSLALDHVVCLARYLGEAGVAPLEIPVGLPELRVLTGIANPTDLSNFHLAPVDAFGEYERIKTLSLPIVELSGRSVCLTNIVEALRDGPQILYLVCHVILREDEPYLFLEEDESRTARPVSGSRLAERLRDLGRLPLLVVLATPLNSATEANRGFDRLSVQLAQIGVPAVITLGIGSLEAGERFLTTCLKELGRDGRIDQAVAKARRAISNLEHEWWRPRLLMRVRNGFLWREEDFSSKSQKSATLGAGEANAGEAPTDLEMTWEKDETLFLRDLTFQSSPSVSFGIYVQSKTEQELKLAIFSREGQPTAVHLPISSVLAAAREARLELARLVYFQQRETGKVRYPFAVATMQTVDAMTIRRAALPLAKAGRKLWELIYANSKPLGEELKTTESGAELAVMYDDWGFALPWNLLYDHTGPLDETTLRWSGFWGYRFAISSRPQATVLKEVSQLPREPLVALLADDPEIEPLAEQALKALAAASGLAIQPVWGHDATLAFLTQPETASLLYGCFFHDPGPQFSAGFFSFDGHQRLRLSNLRALSTGALPGQPLAFLNASGSSALAPYFLEERQASGVVGVDVPLPARLASSVVTFLVYLEQGKTAAESLWQLRRGLLDEHNDPIGLAYSYYGPPGLAFQRPTPAPKSAASGRIVLTSEQLRQLRELLSRYGDFDNSHNLRSLFTDPRLTVWRSGLPEADSLRTRIDRLIDYLISKRNVMGQPALLLLLNTLADRYPPNDARHAEMNALIRELEAQLLQQ